jgi:predicted enzyme related to lactoylglutathione lyase
MAFTINHVEWDTLDPNALKDFLSGVFGWQFAPFGETYFVTDSKQTGASVGINKNPRAVIGNGTPNVYIDVPSIDRLEPAAHRPDPLGVRELGRF